MTRMRILNPDKELSELEQQQIVTALKVLNDHIENGIMVHFTVFDADVLDVGFDNEGIVRILGWRCGNYEMKIMKHAYDTEDKKLTLNY